MPVRNLQTLLKALDAGYQYRPYQMLNYFMGTLMTLWGLPKWEEVPEDIRGRISDAIGVYDTLLQGEEPFRDILGPLYMEMASRGGRSQLGQFFTPWPVATAMATMSMAPAPDTPVTRACDPTCGSGVMMLAFVAEALRQWGPDRLKQLSVTGVDLDACCARMMAVQFVANCNVHRVQLGEVLVLHGDSLRPWGNLDVVLHAHAPSVRVAPALSPARRRALELAGASTLPLEIPEPLSAAG